ncbi:heavy-metal-associated domain-containing protein [Lysobacter koreensis]|uniref:Heavy-metal-associated domain-containing protein n=1 Tax=Lysobacter koreensis TaxID=266122 RepID=A0ABW2YI50_9GAMM
MRARTDAATLPAHPNPDQPMLLDLEKIASHTCGCTIKKAIRAIDPTAAVTVDTGANRVRVEGLLTGQQAISALAAAGYPARHAAPHSGQGSDCCGGCS